MYTAEMLESIKKVEATRAQRLGVEPRRMTAEEKDELLRRFHPDYRTDGFQEIKVGPNKGEKAPFELGTLLHSNSRILNVPINLDKVDYDAEVPVSYTHLDVYKRQVLRRPWKSICSES